MAEVTIESNLVQAFYPADFALDLLDCGSIQYGSTPDRSSGRSLSVPRLFHANLVLKTITSCVVSCSMGRSSVLVNLALCPISSETGGLSVDFCLEQNTVGKESSCSEKNRHLQPLLSRWLLKASALKNLLVSVHVVVDDGSLLDCCSFAISAAIELLGVARDTEWVPVVSASALVDHKGRVLIDADKSEEDSGLGMVVINYASNGCVEYMCHDTPMASVEVASTSLNQATMEAITLLQEVVSSRLAELSSFVNAHR